MSDALTSREVAEAHWQYVQKVLEWHLVDIHDIVIAKNHYIEAFVHGWKHGQEALKEDDHLITPY